jgi:hypothetical protein
MWKSRDQMYDKKKMNEWEKERKKRRRNTRKRKNMSMCKNKVNSPVL